MQTLNIQVKGTSMLCIRAFCCVLKTQNKMIIWRTKTMQTIYINGVKATKSDLAELYARIQQGKECIVEMHTTKSNNIAVTTA